MRALLLLPLLLAPARRVAASFDSSSAGTSTGQFLKLGADARGVGMGQAMSAVSEDSNSLYWNPAGLARVKNRDVSFTHSVMYQSVFYDFITYAQPLGSLIQPERRELAPSGLGTVAVGLLYLNFGQLKEIDNTGLETGGAFTPQDFAAIVGWGGTITHELDVGVNFKYIDSRIQKSARTGALDAGAKLHAYIGEWPWAIAAGVYNAGPGLRYVDRTDPLPLSLRLGQSLQPFRFWTLSCDMVFPRDNAPYPSFGTEGRMALDRDVTIAGRAGWSGRTSGADLDGLTDISLGMGLGFKGMTADYAWAPFGVLGSTHRFSLSYRF